MSTFPLAATAAEMNAAAASHAPADMWVVSRELDQLTEVPAYVALAIRTYTQRLQAEYPIHPAVVEAIHLLYQGQAQLVSLAEEIGPLFRPGARRRPQARGGAARQRAAVERLTSPVSSTRDGRRP